MSTPTNIVPLFGSAPIFAGPAWDKNGNINQAWQRWFNSVVSLQVTSFTPVVQINGSAAGITYASNAGTCMQAGKLVIILLDISIDSIGSSVGDVSIMLPAPIPIAAITGVGCFGSLSNFAGITEGLTAELDAGGTTINLYRTSSTGSVPLTNANLSGGSPGSTFTLSVVYKSN